MKSVRLTHDLKEKIKNNVIKAFSDNYFKELNGHFQSENELVNAIQDEKRIVMEKLWDKRYGQYKEHIDAIPVEMLKIESFTVSAPGHFLSMSLEKRIGVRHTCDLLLDIDEWEESFMSVKLLETQLEQYKNEKDSLSIEVKSILNSVTTTKQLVDVWSSVEPFIPKNIIDPNNIRLPMINIDGINKKIGL